MTTAQHVLMTDTASHHSVAGINPRVLQPADVSIMQNPESEITTTPLDDPALASAVNPPPTETTIETSIRTPNLSYIATADVDTETTIETSIHTPNLSYIATPDVDTDMLDGSTLPPTMALLDESLLPIPLATASSAGAQVLVEDDPPTLNPPPHASHTDIQAEADVVMLPDSVQSPISHPLPHPSPSMSIRPSRRPLPQPPAPPFKTPVFLAEQTPIEADMLLPLDTDRFAYAATPANSRTTPIFPPPSSTPGIAGNPILPGVAQYLSDTVEHALRVNLAESLESAAERALELFVDKYPDLKRTRKGKERARNNADSDPDDGTEGNDHLQRRKKRRTGPRGPVKNHLHVGSGSSDLHTFLLLNAVSIGSRAEVSSQECLVLRTEISHTRTSPSGDDRSVSA
jgi:hypothetical protein